MRFVELTLENYRVFYGRQTLKFGKEEESTSSVILVGGLNGSGKTSILTAIQLLLYGKGSLTEEHYKKKLNGLINNKHFNEGGRACKLKLVIEINDLLYTIYLTFHFDRHQNFSVEEKKLRVSNLYANLTEKDLKDFVNKNIPHEVSSFFIFDGEKIQDLVNQQEEKKLKYAIQKIISIEFYNKITEDLRKAEIKLQREFSSQVSSSALEMIIKRKEELKNEIEELEKRLKHFVKVHDDYKEKKFEVQKIRNEIILKSQNTKTVITQEISTLEQKIERIDKYLIDFAKENLPLLILMPIINDVQKRIKQEFDYLLRKQKVQMNFHQYDEFMKKLLQELDAENLTTDQKNSVYGYGKKVWAKLNNIKETEEPESLEILHDLNEYNRQTLLTIHNNNLQIDVQEFVHRKQTYRAQLTKLNVDLLDAPEAADYTTENDLIDECQSKMGELSLRIRSLTTKKINATSEYQRLQKKYTEQAKLLKTNSELEKQVDLIGKVLETCIQFVEKVTVYKAKCIKEDFENIIIKLLHKSNDFSKIEFDINSYAIKIYNPNGTMVRLVDRSAGEKQIIALCLIWALTKNAGIELPYIIDTPLGRLDSIHRGNLIKHYFPYLSKQVIILSTDTEINKEFNRDILSNVHVSYRLVYDEKQNFTTIKEGYFKF